MPLANVAIFSTFHSLIASEFYADGGKLFADFGFLSGGLSEQVAEVGGEASYFFVEGFAVVLYFGYSDIAAGSEHETLFGDFVSGGDCGKAFLIHFLATAECLEGVGYLFDVGVGGKFAMGTVFHVSHIAGIDEERLAGL